MRRNRRFWLSNVSDYKYRNDIAFAGSSSAMFGKFPVEIIGAAPVGGAIGGLAPALLSILILGLQSDEKTTGFICFLLSTVVNFMGIVIIAGLLKNRYFLSHEASLTHGQSGSHETSVVQDMASKYKDILRSAWKYHVSVLVIFSTTLVVFPAVTALIQPQYKGNFEFSRQKLKPVKTQKKRGVAYF